MSIKRLHKRATKNKVVILLTDGANNAGRINPIKGAELAAEEGLRIYTIGIGADVVPGGFFGFAGRPNAELDERTLQEIARITGGAYYRARNPDELRRIYQTLNRLEPTQQEEELFRPKTELYPWPLGAGFLASMAFGFWLLGRQYLPLRP